MSVGREYESVAETRSVEASTMVLGKVLRELTKGCATPEHRFSVSAWPACVSSVSQGKQFISAIGPKIDNCTEVLKATELSMFLDSLLENLWVCSHIFWYRNNKVHNVVGRFFTVPHCSYTSHQRWHTGPKSPAD